ncbi:MAG: glucosamine-6-phosphate deaminase [Phycisphaerae bacterium]|nr:glucosamine-6-phosphate deaminase [Phycisphaerae bacterium]
MEVIITESYEAMSAQAAKMIAQQILHKPSSVLGLATGSTPVGTYKEMIRMHKEQGLDFSKVVTFNLDEYVGLPPSHNQSYRYFMDHNLFHHINVPTGNIHVPYGHAESVLDFCAWYESEIKRYGGIDIQILGIGGDGHIAFNEPGSSLGSRTRLKTLTQETITDNARFFANMDEVPRFAITMGVGTILEARKIIMLANGSKKAKIVAEAIEGPVSSQVSASALQLHRDVVVILDKEAASKLKRADYYKWVYDQKAKLMPALIGKAT